MHLRRTRRRPPRHDRRSQADDYNNLFVGPGGQIVAVEDHDNAIPNNSGPNAAASETLTSQTFGFAIQSTFAVPTMSGTMSIASTSIPSALSSAALTTSTAVSSAAIAASILSTTATTTPSLTSISSQTTLTSTLLSSTLTSDASSSAYSSTLLPSSSSISPSAAVSSQTTTSMSFASTTFTPLPVSSTITSSSMTSSHATQSSSSSSSSSSPTGSAIGAAVLTSKHPASFYLGVVLGALIGFACLVAFVAWCFRVCSHRHDEDCERSDPWPWDKDDHDHHLESGSRDSSSGNESHWPARIVLDENPEPESGYTLRDPFGIQYPTGAIMIDGVLRGTPRNPMLHSPRHPALHGTPNTIRTPFVPVLHPHQSVPDLAPDIGRLKVANHMPGDVSSGDEGSRDSRQGLELFRSHATPMQVFNRDNGALMNIPLTPMQPQLPRRDGLIRSAESRLPLPGLTQRKVSQAGSERSASWTASIRSNLANAFHAIVGSQASGSSADDLFRSKHTHASINNSTASHESLSSPARIAYDGIEIPAIHLEVEESGNGDWDDLSAWMTNQKLTPRPPSSVVIQPRCTPKPTQEKTPRVKRSPAQPPLPPPLCRVSTSESSEGAEVRRHNANALRRSRKTTKRSTKHRATPSNRLSSLSIGSEMSRMSSTSSGPLTEQERFAKKALKERRRRVLGIRDGATRMVQHETPRRSPLPVSVTTRES